MTDIKNQLSQYLFWDVDMNDLDVERHAAQVIEKVLTLGQLTDWKLIRDYYGMERILKEALLLRYLDERTLNFVSRLFNKPKEEFRCYMMKQSHPGPWKF